MRRDRVVGVMVSADDYEAMRAFHANRLQHNLNQSARLAEAAGLAPQALKAQKALLADESQTRRRRHERLDQRRVVRDHAA